MVLGVRSISQSLSTLFHRVLISGAHRRHLVKRWNLVCLSPLPHHHDSMCLVRCITEPAHLHLIESHCDGRAKKYIRSLPERQRTKAADLIAALKPAPNNADEDSREVRAHGAMLELKQRRDELPAKHARRTHRIADYIDPKHGNLMAIKFRDGFRSKSLKRHLSVRDDTGKASFELIYKRFRHR